jgi:hypothetical protein
MNTLEYFARELINASVEVGSRAIAKAADSALRDVHRGVGRVAKDWDRRLTRARQRLEEISQVPEEQEPEQDDEWSRPGRQRRRGPM